MQEIIVYDLNQTLYKKSSKDEFFKFICYKKGYKLVHLFQIGWLKALGKLRIMSKTYFKENFYDYLNKIPPEKVEKYAKQFWNLEFPEYFREEMVVDIREKDKAGIKVYIVTGGFEVYTKYLEKLLPLKVIGTLTKYENEDYKIIGKTCNDAEKVKRLDAEINGEYRLLEAYSDDDEEILYKAEKGYLLEEGELKLVQKQE
ncbi:haloacid dehalogenase-like hydrolase [Salegentibacter sp. JZCK2]|uniref:HAD family hydrolase n=1 Tax=Salegentibacter tibetensis TaxID=2873600 RepID=UPI001CC9DD29|nr:HAD family hydrolase [Salegentibacter tibetensis]MBZ9730209.1 haloacid dehalogenase-like hydrolase [Salegentibacter tibetensis]